MKAAPSVLAVVVPAQNEQDRLPRCLAALDRARAALHVGNGDRVRVKVVVVADRCQDRTELIAARWPGVAALACDVGRVGAVRALGVRSALALAGDPRLVWIACTDADSVVPTDWLTTQLHFARHGADLLLGTVRPDPAELSPQAHNQWMREHCVADGHPHIHGANLGVRADTYLAVGGFPDVSAHEDVALVNRIEAAGCKVVRTGRSPVLTSARTRGRAPAGMATYLQAMLSGQGLSRTLVADSRHSGVMGDAARP